MTCIAPLVLHAATPAQLPEQRTLNQLVRSVTIHKTGCIAPVTFIHTPRGFRSCLRKPNVRSDKPTPTCKLSFPEHQYDVVVIDTAVNFLPLADRNKRTLRWALATLHDMANFPLAVLILN